MDRQLGTWTDQVLGAVLAMELGLHSEVLAARMHLPGILGIKIHSIQCNRALYGCVVVPSDVFIKAKHHKLECQHHSKHFTQGPSYQV